MLPCGIEGIKASANAMGFVVETTQVVIGVYGFLIVAYVSAFLRQKSARKKAAAMRDELDSMASAFNEVHRELSTMNDGIDSILEEGGPVHDRLAAHTALESAERIIRRQDNLSVGSLCEIMTHPARLLARAMEHHESEAEGSLIGMGTLTHRLAGILDVSGIRPDDLGLNSSEFERLGCLFEEHGGLENARDAYEASLREGHRYDGMSGLLRVLRSMGSGSDLVEALESHIVAEPDEIAALVEQLSLLPESDARSRRNKKRLSSLGWDGETEIELIGSLDGLRARATGPSMAEVSPSVKISRAASRIENGKPDEGLEILDMLSMEDRISPGVLFLRAKASHMKGDHELALKLVRRSNVDSDDAILLEVSAMVSMGEAESALNRLTNRVYSDGCTAAICEASAKLAIAMDLPEVAWRVLGECEEDARTIGVLDARAMALIHKADKQRNQSGSVLASIVSDLEECGRKMVGMDREDHRGWLTASIAQRMNSNLEDAETCIVRARRIADREPRVLIEEARVRIDRMEFGEARSVLIECDKLRADKVEIGFLNGLSYAREGRIEDAERRFASVLELDPSHVSARLNLASVYLSRNQYSEAANHAMIVVDSYPENPSAMRRASEAMIGLSEWSKAIELLESSLSIDHGHVASMTRLSSCLLRTGRGAQAEEMLNEAIRIDPSQSGPWSCRGSLYLEFNRIAEATSDLEKAWECDPRRSDVLMMLAELEERTGDFRAASIRWRQVLDLDPTDQHARSRLEIVRGRTPEEAERIHLR